MRTKRCSVCKDDVPVASFNKRSSSKDGLQTICKACSRERSRAYYKANRATHYKITKAATARYRDRNRLLVAEHLRANPCVDCGECDPVVLEFDHITGVKYTEISRLVNYPAGLAKLITEIKKCVVRCANCHRRKTAIEQKWWIVEAGAIE